MEELPGDALLLTAATPRWPGVPKSLVKLMIRVRIARFLLVILSYSPFRAQILLWKSTFPLPLSTWQSFVVVIRDKEEALSLPLPPTRPLCHKLPEHRANARARHPNLQHIFPGAETPTALINYK